MTVPRVRWRGRPDRLAVVMSDIEMGAGGAVDDFPHSPFLGDILRSYLAPKYDDLQLDLVFNGDTFDLLKTSYRGEWPKHVTSEVAVGKMSRIADAHPEFFRALREILDQRGDRARVHFVAGNHDLELFFPEVLEIIRELCGDGDRVIFHGHGFDLGRMHVEHGSQLDPLFRVDSESPFLEHNGKKILDIAWASVALLEVVMPLQPILGHHDRLKPKKRVLELLPEVKEYITGLAWDYWTRGFWRDYWAGTDPVKRVTWSMVKEVVARMVSLDPEVAMEDLFQRQMVTSDRYDLYVVGHEHQAAMWSFGDRKVLRPGFFRDEFMVSADGWVQTAINKSWGEVYMSGDEVVRSQILEVESPPRPPGTMPESIFECLPAIRARMQPVEKRKDERAAQQAQEILERAQE